MHMAVSGKVPVGNNSSIALVYGGEKVGVAGPIESPLGPTYGLTGPHGPMSQSGRPPAAGADRPTGGLPLVFVERRRTHLNRTLPHLPVPVLALH